MDPSKLKPEEQFRFRYLYGQDSQRYVDGLVEGHDAQSDDTVQR